MHRFLLRAAPFAAVLAFAACNSGGTSSPIAPATNLSEGVQSFARAAQSTSHLPPGYARACNGSRQGFAQCEVLYSTGVHPDLPSGHGPPDIQSAYNLPSATKGSGQTVAIVDAFDDPNAASDLAVYRSTFGLPVANFTKYNQEGQQSNYPSPNSGWALEETLDLDMVSAGCPNCNIILVEGNSNSFSDLGASVDEAAKLGATVISNSYSGSGVNPADYRHAGTTILAAAGDNGYGIGDPADLPTVVSVGGTSLVKGGGSRGWTESAWVGTGSGCSTDKKPKWQTDTGCTFRTANDVAAVALDLSIYDTYQSSGWQPAAGTSASTPLIASVFGLAGNANKQAGGRTFWRTAHHKDMWDITTGENGQCNPAYLCQAGPGYDGPTGWGTPNGIGGF